MSTGMDGPWLVTLAADSPVLIHVPHASTTVPADVRSTIELSDAELGAELRAMTDWHTDRIATAAVSADGAGSASMFVNQLSRLVVDPERFPDDREVMRTVGMGAVYTSTSDGRVLRSISAAQETAMLDAYFHPYAAALADLVDEVLERHGRCIIIDLHSFPARPLPYEFDPAAPRPEICLGTDAAHTPTWLSDAAEAAFDSFEIAWNTPFAGTYVPLRHYGREANVSSIMIEIRRDLYLDTDHQFIEHGLARTSGSLGRLVASLL
jgi:N-formylglutamate amidohydrolase